MFFVYIIKNNDYKTYTGHTNNLERRMAEHNSGLSPYTRGKGPWAIVYSEEFKTRGEAMKREKFLKSGKGRELLKTLING